MLFQFRIGNSLVFNVIQQFYQCNRISNAIAVGRTSIEHLIDESIDLIGR